MIGFGIPIAIFHIMLSLALLYFGITFADDYRFVNQMIPRGKIIHRFGNDFNLRTPSGTKVLIQCSDNLSLKQALGQNLGKGDIFEPGNGLLSLDGVARILEQRGFKVRGFWKIERDRNEKWIYRIQKYEKEDTENIKGLLIDAKTADILNEKN